MKNVTFHVRLPANVAAIARRIDVEDGDFFRRVVEVAVIRHGIYASLRASTAARARDAGERVMDRA